MKLIFARIVTTMSHRLLLPVVCALFLTLYIAIAFFTDEALVTLVQLVGHNPLALGLLALVVINASFRMAGDLRSYLTSRQAVAGAAPAAVEGVFAQSLAVSGQLDTDEVGRILGGEGYRVTVRDGSIAAVRGVSLICPRLLWRLALLLLFAGVALSLSTRTSLRMPVIEGEPLQVGGVAQFTVARIALEDTPGHWFLQRRLTVGLADGEGRQSAFGIYPPGMVGDSFLYPRYLGVAPLLRLNAPGVTEPFEGYQLIMLYPPGREDKVELINGYHAQFVILQRDGMPDPFVSGRYDLHVKLLKGDQLIAEGDIPFGGRFEADGFSVELLGSTRFVVTDLVRDYGVLFIWLASAVALLAFMLYLPLRCLCPRRVMLFFAYSEGRIVACCSSEGKRHRHEALFHDMLDRLCRNGYPVGDVSVSARDRD